MEDENNTNIAVIHDDAHARAILLGIMRKEREVYMSRYRAMEKAFVPKRYNKKQYRTLCSQTCDLYGDALVYQEVVKHPKTKREKMYIVAFGGLQNYDEKYSAIKTEKLYPITLEVIDSKVTSKTGLVRDIFDISEHALIRMIRRNQCSSMNDLVILIKKYIEPFIPATVHVKAGEPFVAISGEAYLPCVLGETGNVIVKSWISRSSWTPKTEAKLCQVCDYLMLENAVALIPQEIFSCNLYLDPGSIQKYIVRRR